MLLRFITLSACALAGITCGSLPASAHEVQAESNGEYRGSWEGSWDSDGNYDGVWSGTYYHAQPADIEAFRYPEPQRSSWIAECRKRFLDARSVTGSERENSSIAGHVQDQCEDYLKSYEVAYSRQYGGSQLGSSDQAITEAENLPSAPKVRAMKRRDTAHISSENIDSGAVTYPQ